LILGRRFPAWLALVFVLLPWPGAAPADGANCHSDRRGEHAVSARVFDGDTLALTDGRKVRLLGINTPEIGRDGKPSEPLADDARRMLSSLAGPGTDLRLRVDVERFDRYGRLLAHVFSARGDNLQARLLDAGLATTLVVPPNQWAVDCYAAVEAGARSRQVGIWRLDAYQPVSAESLDAAVRGYRMVRGHVQRVGESRGNLWLNLSRHMAVRIPREDLVYFGALDPRQLAGRRVEARGWIHRRKGELRMTVRHPAALTVIE
jgi:endonuclease YncB( thermonuclease family)